MVFSHFSYVSEANLVPHLLMRFGSSTLFMCHGGTSNLFFFFKVKETFQTS